ncbi:MAG: SpoIIE family protein phosphatase [Planctomycetota bacterium]
MDPQTIRIESLDGGIPAIRLDPDRLQGGAVIGRQRDLPYCVPHGSISRRHCIIEHRHDSGSDRWTVTDLGSKNGTWLHDKRLSPNVQTLLMPGAQLRLGTLEFVIRAGNAIPSVLSTFSKENDRVSTVVRPQDQSDHFLQTLLQYASMAYGASSESELAEAMVRAAIGVGRFSRVGVIRTRAGDDSFEQVDVLASAGDASGSDLSRSLLRAAVQEQVMVRLDSTDNLEHAVSIMGLNITSALCVPVMVGSSIEALLYADIRDQAPQSIDRAAPVCEAIARLGGLGLASLMRAAAERQQLRMRAEVDAARTVQERLLPPETGAIGPIEYALQMRPGRDVAGDLIGMSNVEGGGVAFFLGDVSGKGLAAGLLMSRVQAQLEALLGSGQPLAQAVGNVNRRLVHHSAPDQFVTLWIGVLDPESHTLRYVDAGHGYAAIDEGNGAMKLLRPEGNIPLGIIDSESYDEYSIPFSEGMRVAIFSDGAVEQTNRDGMQFGTAPLLELLSADTDPIDTIRSIAHELDRWSGSSQLDDDLSTLLVTHRLSSETASPARPE